MNPPPLYLKIIPDLFPKITYLPVQVFLMYSINLDPVSPYRGTIVKLNKFSMSYQGMKGRHGVKFNANLNWSISQSSSVLA